MAWSLEGTTLFLVLRYSGKVFQVPGNAETRERMSRQLGASFLREQMALMTTWNTLVTSVDTDILMFKS